MTGPADRAGNGDGFGPELWDFLGPAEQAGEIGRLGGYRVLRVLGAGGMGVVFEARDPRLERTVALKAMRPTLAVSESARQRFLREARAAAALQHDHVVAIFQVGEERGIPFFAMPLLRGESLEDRLSRDRILGVPEVLRIGREAAKGLAAAHAAGLVHRDIKPANLWLEGEEGRVKVLDFGLARQAAHEAQLTQQGAITGTPAYMAPEQAAGKPVDGRCDLFSLGCVLYRLCTGRLPFQGTDPVSTLVAVATETPIPPAVRRPELPVALSEFIVRLLAKEPGERPPSAQAVVEELSRLEKRIEGKETVLLEPKPRKARGAGVRTRPVRGGWKKVWLPWMVGGGVLALNLLGVALFLYWPREYRSTPGKGNESGGGVWRVAQGPADLGPQSNPPGEPALPSGGPPEKVPEKVPEKEEEVVGTEADREAADWVLGCGGIVSVVPGAGGAPVQIFPQYYGGFVLSSDDGALLEKVTRPADAKNGLYAPRRFVLSHVNLWGRSVNDADLRRLSGLRGLRWLNLGHTAVSNQGLEHLRGMPWLATLRLDRTRVTAEGVRRLREALPRCGVFLEPAISYAQLAARTWTPVLNRPADFRGKAGIRFTNGTLEFLQPNHLSLPFPRGQDLAVRARVKKLGGNNLSLTLRKREKGWDYIAYFDGGNVFGMGQHKGPFVNFRGVGTPKSYADFFEMAFAARGETLAVFVEGEQIMEYRDPNPQGGEAGVGCHGGPSQFRQIEVQKLE